MSGARYHDRGCDPEVIFELAERTLDEDRKRRVLAHLEECPGCRELYEREMSLNAFLGSVEFAELRSRSVCRGVAMALPTRPVKARLMWAVLALGLLVVALLALAVGGAQPTGFFTGLLGASWGVVVAGVEMVHTLLATAGWMMLAALMFGAIVDLIIAAAVLSLTRRRTREA